MAENFYVLESLSTHFDCAFMKDSRSRLFNKYENKSVQTPRSTINTEKHNADKQKSDWQCSEIMSVRVSVEMMK